MIIEQIKLNGFLSFINDVVDLRQHHILLILGPNGEGKSALLESIPFCFWGTGRGKKLSEYINNKCESAKVEVLFLFENNRYKKIRQCGNVNINELYIDKNNEEYEKADWKLISDDTKRKTDELLTSILGLDYKLFSNSVFFGQKEMSSFIDGESAERKELLCNLLGIQVYEQAEENAKIKLKEIKNQLQLKNMVLNDKKILIEQSDSINEKYLFTKKQLKSIDINIETLQKNLEELREKKELLKIEEINYKLSQEKIIEINEQIIKNNLLKAKLKLNIESLTEEIEQIIDEGINVIEKLSLTIDEENDVIIKKEEYEVKLKEINIEKSKIPALKLKLDAQRNSKERLLQQQTEITTILKSLNDKKNKIEKSGALCPIIEQSCEKLSKENKKKMLDDLKVDIESYKSKIETLETEYEIVGGKIVDLNGKIEIFAKRIENESIISSNLTNMNNKLEFIKIAKDELPKNKIKYRTKVDKLTLSKENYEKQLVSLNDEIQKLDNKLKILSNKIKVNFEEEMFTNSKKINACNDDIKEFVNQKNMMLAQFGQLKNDLERLNIVENDIKKLQKDVSILNNDEMLFTELCQIFGKNGIQKDIIVNNVPILEQKTNELLALFTKNNQLLVKFDLDPITGSGKAKKQGGLNIIIYQNGVIPRSLNMYSGGETVRIIFAILLSLSYLLIKRAGKSSQTLIIDERVAALDAEGINQFIDVIKMISNQYKKILIVSHITELKETFNDVMLIKKDENGSKVIFDEQV